MVRRNRLGNETKLDSSYSFILDLSLNDMLVSDEIEKANPQKVGLSYID